MPATTTMRSTATTMRTAAAMEARQRMFPASAVVRRGDHISVPIVRLIRLEVVELLRAPSRDGTVIPMVRVIPVVDVSMEPIMPMEPRPSPYKQATRKPIRPIVPIRRAIIRRIVKVPIRTIRRNSDPDNNL
jgi:hypothetical protein